MPTPSIPTLLRAVAALALLAALVPTAPAQPDDWCATSAGGPPPSVPAGFQPGTPPSIPVVFHVITKSDGTGDLADSTVAAQIDVMNAAYAGTTISFSLLGIGRVENDMWHDGMPVFIQPAQYLNVAPAHVLNVYVGHDPEDVRFGGATQPSVLPGDVGTARDGVYLSYLTFPGTTHPYFDAGDVAVHEAGHYFDLLHTWGPGDGSCSVDDGIADTPNHKEVNYGCPAAEDTCPTLPGLDPIDNYMNGTNDSCRDTFSDGQNDVQEATREDERLALGQVVPTVYDARSGPVTLSSPFFSGQLIYVLPGADVTVSGAVTLTNGAGVVAVGGADLSGIDDLTLSSGSLFDVRGYDGTLDLGNVAVSGGSTLRLGVEGDDLSFGGTFPGAPALTVDGIISSTGTGSSLEMLGGSTLTLGASSVALFDDSSRYVTQGGTGIGDDAEFIFEPDAAAPEVTLGYASPTFALGRDARLVFRNGGYVLGEAIGGLLTFGRADPNEAWDHLAFEGDDVILANATVEGGTTGALVRARGIVFDDVTLSGNGTGIETDFTASSGTVRSELALVDSRVEESTTTGLYLRNADVAISSTTLRHNTQYGVYVSNATLEPLADNLVTGTGYDEYGNPLPGALIGDGVWVGADGDLHLFSPFQASGLNRIADNLGDEIETADGAYLFLGSYYGGDNAVFKSGGIPAGKYLIRNVDRSPVLAEHTYWGDTNGPPSGAFYYEPLIDYDPYLKTDPTGGAGAPLRSEPGGEGAPDGAPLASARGGGSGPGEWLRERIRQLREQITADPTHPRALRLLHTLYRLQRLDRDDILGEHVETMALLAGLRSHLGEGPLPPRLQKAAEQAFRAEVADALRAGDYDAAEALLAEYAAYVEDEETRYGLLLSAASVDEQRRRYAEAIGKINEVIAALPPEAEEYAFALGHEVAAIERRMGEGGAGRTAGTSKVSTEPARSTATVPEEFALGAAYPNPLDASAVVPFEISEGAEVRVAVYDVLGREVAVLTEGRREAGRFRVRFNASEVTSGVYVVRAVMTSESSGTSRVFSQKLTVVK